MIDIRIPKEINRYEVKTVGPFTTRQAIALAIGAPLAILTWNLTHMQALLMVIAVPAWAYGWYKPYGMHIEDFLKAAFISNMLSPKYRKYKTENYYQTIADEIAKEDAVGKKKDKYKKSKKACL